MNDFESNQPGFSFKRDLGFCLFYFILTAIYFNKLLWSSTVCISAPETDITLYFFPVRSFGFSNLARGVIPFWNPHTFGDAPYLANPQTALFYPFNIIFLFLPTVLSINILCAFHLSLSGVCAYVLARKTGQTCFASFIAGICYAYCGQQILRIYAGHLTINAILPWIPLFLFFLYDIFEKPGHLRLVIASVILALAIFAGNPQYVFYLGLASALFCIVHSFEKKRAFPFSEKLKRVFRFILVIFSGFLLCSIQLFPSLAFTRESVRAEGLEKKEAGVYSMPPKQLFSLVSPNYFGADINNTYRGDGYEWETNAYCGMIPFILALLGLFSRKRRNMLFYWILAILGIVIALGKHTPFFHLFYYVLPGFKLFRGHAKAVILTNLCLAMLAGFGFDFLVHEKYFQKPFQHKLARILVFILLLLELSLFAWSRRAVTSPGRFQDAALSKQGKLQKSKPESQSYFRTLNLVPGEQNFSLVSGKLGIAGYDANQLSRFRNFMNSAQGLPLDTPQLTTDIRELNLGYLVPFGVRKVILPGQRTPGPEGKYLRKVKTLESFDGMVRTLRDVRTFSSPDAVLKEMKNPEFSFFDHLLIESEEPLPMPGKAPKVSDTIKIEEWNINSIKITAEAETACYLLISNIHTSDWKALVNGENAPLYVADYLFQAVYLSGGKHSILLKYRPLSFLIGSVLTISTIICFLILIFCFRRQQRRKNNS